MLEPEGEDVSNQQQKILDLFVVYEQDPGRFHTYKRSIELLDFQVSAVFR